MNNSGCSDSRRSYTCSDLLDVGLDIVFLFIDFVYNLCLEVVLEYSIVSLIQRREMIFDVL